jgi:hypothetical protein
MEKYHKLVKHVADPKPGFRLWIDKNGDLYETNLQDADYKSAQKVKISERNAKRTKRIADAARKKANKKAKQLAKLEAQKAAILRA